jgi:hypothetical protein
MWQDPIVAETRALREEYSASLNHDAHAIFNDLVSKQAEHSDRLVSFPPRKPFVSEVAAEQFAAGRRP